MACSTRSQPDCAKPKLLHEADLSDAQTLPMFRSANFDLIARFFKRSTLDDRYVALGAGDDCALLTAFSDEQWAVSIDTLIEGVHFLPDVDAAALGHKSLAVNLSDLAACGATPRCFFIALALPRVDETWLAAFTRGLYALADAHQCVLAGGDTTRSPSGVVITITALGVVPAGRALLRSGARVGDDIWVSGELGDAALGLAVRRGKSSWPQRKHSKWSPALSGRCRAFGWQSDCAISRVRRSTFRMDWQAICDMYCEPPPWAPRSNGRACRVRRRCSGSRCCCNSATR